MFKRIELTDPFGVHKNFIYDFQKGLTVISGPNGTGKTLITEMLEASMFGVEALRGPASDYKGLDLKVWVEIRGIGYRIERRGTTVAELYLEGQEKPIASGIKFVNQKVKDLLGYSYDVFRVTNVARQGEIERMGTMLPKERKALVDETIGLAKIEALADWASKQQTLASGKLSVLTDLLVQPGPAPEPVAEFPEAQVKALQTQRGLWQAHKGYLTAPEAPTPHARAGETEALRAQQQARVQALARKEGLETAVKGFPALGQQPVLHARDSELMDLEAETARFAELTSGIQTIQAALRSYPEESSVPDKVLDEAERLLGLHTRWIQKQQLLGTLVNHTCPKCEHTWHEDNPRLKDFEDITEDSICPMSSKEIAEERRVNSYQELRRPLVEGLEAAKKELAGLKSSLPLIAEIKAARKQLDAYGERLKNEQQRLDLIKKIELMDVPADVFDLLKELQAYEAQVQVYQQQLGRHQEAVEAVKGIPETVEADTAQAERSLSAYQNYLYAVTTHQAAVDRYNSAFQAVEAQKLVVQDWRNARDAVTLLRARIKGYLLPSLNDVASKILFNMSNQWLNWIVVNEDFDITVDSKSIKVLSGAGKALTNLALRIGLGQVLTNSVFPVLILDEADAGVDKEKAPMVAQALRRLTGTIAQIIVISHKAGIEADHNLELS